MKRRLVAAVALGLGLVITPVARADPPAAVQQEIDHLLQYIGASGCEFKRNGSWNDAKAAEVHVRDKYYVLLRMSMVETTKDFIDKAATESSVSGTPYEIKCDGNPPIPSNRWLNIELLRFQAQRATAALTRQPSARTHEPVAL
jgi:hypothetical protein